MTDSGSFDSGDLMHGADLAALHALVAARCSAAGVAGPGCPSSVFASGSVCTAAHVNDLVAAYQRAWDASSNKPGTRQDQVSAGGLVYGSLFQNMWTQLNQMTVNRWLGWTETSEAAMADDDNWVVMFEGGGTEYGQGLEAYRGSNAHDVYIYGNVAAATGSPPYRQGTNGSFTWQTWIGNNTFAGASTASQWSIITKVADLAYEAGDRIFHGSSISLYVNSSSQYAVDFVKGGTTYTASTTGAVPTSGIVYFLLWHDGTNNIRGGFVTEKTGSWASISSANKFTLGISGKADEVASGWFYALMGGSYVNVLNSGRYYYVLMSRKSHIS